MVYFVALNPLQTHDIRIWSLLNTAKCELISYAHRNVYKQAKNRFEQSKPNIWRANDIHIVRLFDQSTILWPRLWLLSSFKYYDFAANSCQSEAVFVSVGRYVKTNTDTQIQISTKWIFVFAASCKSAKWLISFHYSCPSMSYSYAYAWIPFDFRRDRQRIYVIAWRFVSLHTIQKPTEKKRTKQGGGNKSNWNECWTWKKNIGNQIARICVVCQLVSVLSAVMREWIKKRDWKKTNDKFTWQIRGANGGGKPKTIRWNRFLKRLRCMVFVLLKQLMPRNVLAQCLNGICSCLSTGDFESFTCQNWILC